MLFFFSIDFLKLGAEFENALNNVMFITCLFNQLIVIGLVSHKMFNRVKQVLNILLLTYHKICPHLYLLLLTAGVLNYFLIALGWY